MTGFDMRRVMQMLAVLLAWTLWPAAAHAQYPCNGPGPGERMVGMTQGGNGVASIPLCVRDDSAAAPAPVVTQAAPQALANPRSYADIVALAGEKRDVIVKIALEQSLRPVSISEGRREVALVENADPAIIQTLSARLKLWTGRQWLITLKNDAQHVPTLREQRDERHEAVRQEAHQDPLVQAILDTFPGATVRVTVKQEQIPIEAYADMMNRDSDEDDDE